MTDQDIMARTIVGEARGEGDEGMIAVACVIMNRVAAHSWWGQTVTDVCLKPLQFSCWNHDDPNLPIIQALDETKSIFRDALDIAARVISCEQADITNGATHYYASGIPGPYWSRGKTPCATIGHHLFFKDIG